MVQSFYYLKNCKLFPFSVAHIENASIYGDTTRLHSPFKSTMDEEVFGTKLKNMTNDVLQPEIWHASIYPKT